MKEKRRKSRISREQVKDIDEEDDDEQNAEDVADLFNDRGGRKRKIAAPTVGEEGDKKRIEDEKVLEEKAEEEEPEPAKRPRLDSASNVDDLPKIDDKTPCEYGPIDLADFTSSEDLELLGLEHLKSALTDRCLKCGGSLSERASRLWSIKGKELKDWPKSILTPELKKKVAEEEEAARKAAKKAKKSKK